MDLGLYGNAALRHLPLAEWSRYRSERDEQLLGYDEVARIDHGYASLPITERPAPRYVYCEDCQTTWLVGLEGEVSAKNHPFHNTLFQKQIWQSRRSLVVHVHGACPDDGAALGKSSVGIFFGAASSYNRRYIESTPDPTQLTAGIVAATRAVHHVRKNFIPNRQGIARTARGVHWEDRWSPDWSTSRLERYRNNWMFRLIIVTDSIYLVECLCNYRRGWKLTPGSTYLDSHGAPLQNGALFVELLGEIDKLAREGVEVM